MSSFPTFDEMLRGINKLTLKEMYRLNKILVRNMKSVQHLEACTRREYFAAGDTVKFFDARPIAGGLERTGKLIKLGRTNAHVDVKGRIWKIPFNKIVKV